MKNIKLFSILAVGFLLLFSSCKKDEPELPVVNKNPNLYVNDWIYEQMNIYYLWNDKIPKSPDYTLKPDLFFNSLINKYNVSSNPDGDRFSWIQENYVDLINSLGGVVSDEIGFEYVRVAISGTEASTKQYYLLVLYPKLGSDAHAKGVRKGRFVTKIDNQDILETNYKTLTSGTGTKTLTMADWVFNQSTGKHELKLSGNLTVQMHKDFAEIPVYLDSVYTTPNNKKTGYLVYNFFARDKGDGTYDYDKLLMTTLNEIKTKGATEFILDLRYNGGGAVSTATALASALVPNRSTTNTFSTVQYNALVQSELQKEGGENFNVTYFADKITDSKNNKIADIPSMGISTLYVLVSNWSASASELVINGLKPYMNVILIGETTVGKNVGSISLYEENDAKNKWGMQPIIAKYFNSAGKSDFTAGFVPDYEVDEFADLRLVDFGNTNDVLLNKALTLINDAPLQAVPARAPVMDPKMQLRKVPNSQSMLEKPGKTVMNDDIRGEKIRSIMKKRMNE